jgi:hypothetical protein
VEITGGNLLMHLSEIQLSFYEFPSNPDLLDTRWISNIREIEERIWQ